MRYGTPVCLLCKGSGCETFFVAFKANVMNVFEDKKEIYSDVMCT